MLRTIVRVGVLAVLLCVSVGDAARPGPRERSLAIRSHITGGLSFRIVGGRVELSAAGDGHATQLGDITADATWSPSAADARRLMLGEIDTLHINTGVFSIESDDGDTLNGTIAGTVTARGHGTFDIDIDFDVTGGTGALAGATGVGSLHGVQTLDKLSFKANVRADVTVPPK